MPILCGVDIIEVDRLKKSFETLGSDFRDRIFTPKEINYCESRNLARFRSYAARFAAKEAIAKAFGTGIGEDLEWKDMEIANNSSGKPFVMLSEKAMLIYRKLNIRGIELSLSHCENYAVAYAVIQTGNTGDIDDTDDTVKTINTGNDPS